MIDQLLDGKREPGLLFKRQDYSGGVLVLSQDRSPLRVSRMLRIALTLEVACTQFRSVCIAMCALVIRGEELTSFAEVRLSVLTAMSFAVYIQPSPRLLSGVPVIFPLLLLCTNIYILQSSYGACNKGYSKAHREPQSEG